MQVDPLSNQSRGRTRFKVAPCDISQEVKHGFMTLILRMDVRGIVLVKEHSDDDSEKSAKLWHNWASYRTVKDSIFWPIIYRVFRSVIIPSNHSKLTRFLSLDYPCRTGER